VRMIDVSEITEVLARIAAESCFVLGRPEMDSLRAAGRRERSALGREILGELLENAEVAREERRPLCQDTGTAVVFLDIGQDVRLVGGDIREAVDRGVARAYRENSLRASVLSDPFLRENSGDNTPAILHVSIVPGERVRLLFAAKGGGAENMSRLAMLSPADGEGGVVEFVLGTVREAGGRPCPPLVIGVGVGGNFETVALLAKRALLRPLGEPNPEKRLARIEEEILARVNATGIGPQGLGGSATALAVHLDVAPCHIASLPAAVNLDCHSHRHAEAIL